MIVDVLRNDLGRVAAIGSVEVPTLMGVESFETVHQLVSTVRARLRPGATILDCLHAAFPGGSMTGAPKLRTMELIDALEGRPRGHLLGRDRLDRRVRRRRRSRIAIRTIVNSAAGMTIGAGGAITVQSDPQAELDELLLKARAPLEAVGLALHGERGRGDARPRRSGCAARLARVPPAMGITHLDEATVGRPRRRPHQEPLDTARRVRRLGDGGRAPHRGGGRLLVARPSTTTAAARRSSSCSAGAASCCTTAAPAEIGENDAIVCLAGAGAHSIYGTGSLDVLAFGPRHVDLSTRFPRLGLSMIGARFVESVAPEPGTMLQFTREIEARPPGAPRHRPAARVDRQPRGRRGGHDRASARRAHATQPRRRGRLDRDRAPARDGAAGEGGDTARTATRWRRRSSSCSTARARSRSTAS